MFLKHQDARLKKAGAMSIFEYPINANYSGALIDLDGYHGNIKCIGEDRIYFIISGTGEFLIDGEKSTVAANDLVFIPKNTTYDIKGKLHYFLVCAPAFSPEHDVQVKDLEW